MAVDVLEILRIYYKITAFTSEIVGSILTADSGQSGNALWNILGFLRVLQFLPQSTLTGWVRISPLLTLSP
jgi:hypothetical protein